MTSKILLAFYTLISLSSGLVLSKEVDPILEGTQYAMEWQDVFMKEVQDHVSGQSLVNLYYDKETGEDCTHSQGCKQGISQFFQKDKWKDNCETLLSKPVCQEVVKKSPQNVLNCSEASPFSTDKNENTLWEGTKKWSCLKGYLVGVWSELLEMVSLLKKATDKEYIKSEAKKAADKVDSSKAYLASEIDRLRAKYQKSGHVLPPERALRMWLSNVLPRMFRSLAQALTQHSPQLACYNQEAKSKLICQAAAAFLEPDVIIGSLVGTAIVGTGAAFSVYKILERLADFMDRKKIPGKGPDLDSFNSKLHPGLADNWRKAANDLKIEGVENIDLGDLSETINNLPSLSDNKKLLKQAKKLRKKNLKHKKNAAEKRRIIADIDQKLSDPTRKKFLLDDVRLYNRKRAQRALDKYETRLAKVNKKLEERGIKGPKTRKQKDIEKMEVDEFISGPLKDYFVDVEKEKIKYEFLNGMQALEKNKATDPVAYNEAVEALAKARDKRLEVSDAFDDPLYRTLVKEENIKIVEAIQKDPDILNKTFPDEASRNNLSKFIESRSQSSGAPDLQNTNKEKQQLVDIFNILGDPDRVIENRNQIDEQLRAAVSGTCKVPKR